LDISGYDADASFGVIHSVTDAMARAADSPRAAQGWRNVLAASGIPLACSHHQLDTRRMTVVRPHVRDGIRSGYKVTTELGCAINVCLSREVVNRLGCEAAWYAHFNATQLPVVIVLLQGDDVVLIFKRSLAAAIGLKRVVAAAEAVYSDAGFRVKAAIGWDFLMRLVSSRYGGAGMVARWLQQTLFHEYTMTNRGKFWLALISRSTNTGPNVLGLHPAALDVLRLTPLGSRVPTTIQDFDALIRWVISDQVCAREMRSFLASRAGRDFAFTTFREAEFSVMAAHTWRAIAAVNPELAASVRAASSNAGRLYGELLAVWHLHGRSQSAAHRAKELMTALWSRDNAGLQTILNQLGAPLLHYWLTHEYTLPSLEDDGIE
jgi:hypothetical protein